MKERSVPKYLEISRRLMDYFSDRGVKVGDRIPTESSIMDEFGASRTTVRQALAILKDEQVIESVRGSGMYFCGNARDFQTNDPSEQKLIGLVNFFSMDYIYADIIQGIRNTVEEAGYHLVLAHCGSDPEKELTYTRNLIKQGVQGLIIEPSRGMDDPGNYPIAELMLESDIPVVALNWDIGFSGCSIAAIDDELSGFTAASYLLSRGHRNIGIIYPKDVLSGRSRYNGFLKALNKRALHPDQTYVAGFISETSISEEVGYQLTHEMLEKASSVPTAIFYFNDMLAAQGYRALKELGKSIPHDISVIGFDNHHTSGVLRPGLTTFEHPKFLLGSWAAKILLDKIENQNRLTMKMIFEPEIVERGSVRTISQ